MWLRKVTLSTIKGASRLARRAALSAKCQLSSQRRCSVLATTRRRSAVVAYVFTASTSRASSGSLIASGSERNARTVESTSASPSPSPFDRLCDNKEGCSVPARHTVFDLISEHALSSGHPPFFVKKKKNLIFSFNINNYFK